MEVTSVSLPKWKGKDKMSDSEIGTYDSSILKTKKVTAYAEAVRGIYKTLRNITIDIFEGSNYAQKTLLGTHYTGNYRSVWNLATSGSIGWDWTSGTYGIRPAIEY